MHVNTEFKVEVSDIIEHEDGSATVIFDTCQRGRQALISYGLLKVLEAAASAALPEEEELEFDFEKGESKDED